VVARSTERPDERLARHIVSTVLGVPVERHDYGTAPRQVDALVCYPDRVAALEVVADPDKEFNDQQVALYGKKNPLEVPGLRKSWIVLLSRQAKINNVKRALPALLLDLQDNPPPKRSLGMSNLRSLTALASRQPTRYTKALSPVASGCSLWVGAGGSATRELLANG